jgi:hypothetical protein
MHRTQFQKKKNRNKDLRKEYLFVFLSFSQLDVWEELWVQSELCQIIQQYQCMMADLVVQLSASSVQQPKHQHNHEESKLRECEEQQQRPKRCN